MDNTAEGSPSSQLFGSFHAVDESLKHASRVAMEEVLQAKRHEQILIVTNPHREVYEISLALYDAAATVGASPVLVVQPTKSQLDSTEDAVVGAIKSAPDILISMSALKIGQDREAAANPIEHEGVRYDRHFHYLLYGSKTLRSFWSPGVTREIFTRTVPIDYRSLKSSCSAVGKYLDDAISLHITAGSGTDVTVGLRNRFSKLDDGDFSRPGLGGNLPAGEAFISPELGTAQGTIVFDGSITLRGGDIIIAEPIRAVVAKGMVTTVTGGKEADRLNETLSLAERNALLFEKEGHLPAGQGEIYCRNARNLGEIGIGLNPAARISGNMLEDEKVYRTCHIAIGSNYDEDAPSLIHLDGLIMNPTISARFADGSEKTFLKEGELE